MDRKRLLTDAHGRISAAYVPGTFARLTPQETAELAAWDRELEKSCAQDDDRGFRAALAFWETRKTARHAQAAKDLASN